MMDALKVLLKQPYWFISLLLGALFVVVACVKVGSLNLTPLAPNTLLIVGIVLMALSWCAFGYTLLAKRTGDPVDLGSRASYEPTVGAAVSTAGSGAMDIGTGVDLRRVRTTSGGFSATVEGCQILVVNGHIEECPRAVDTVMVLPCSEYFDDYCVRDTKSALGAYVNRVFEGQADAFITLMKSECLKKFGAGKEQQKTDDERAISFGPGKCLLLLKPLNHPVPVALVSTTTQRAGQGLAARISYLFDGMGELLKAMADSRIGKAVMPILGAGHGRIDTPLAFVGLLLALAEAARYGQGGQRLRKVTIVVYKPSTDTPAEVDPVVQQRALAIVGS